ncbi:hypothetical protein [Streptomyces catenulae]|uniref:Uncharacterized protein n=1 Tax=Streptomyces catenulae TaxID=66875 RepID=A0ABV2YTY2_9ACTN|nr:hypothetical protein [Streptomyces catenulae]
MTDTFKMDSGVNFAKQADVLSNPDLWEQNANLRKRLFEVACERDSLSTAVGNASGIVGDLISENRFLGDVEESLEKVTRGLAADVNTLRSELDRFKDQVREELCAVFEAGEIDRETADEFLKVLDLAPLPRKYRTTVTIEVTLEDLCRNDGEPIRAEDVSGLLDLKVQGKGVTFDGPDCHVEVGAHDTIVGYF